MGRVYVIIGDLCPQTARYSCTFLVGIDLYQSAECVCCFTGMGQRETNSNLKKVPFSCRVRSGVIDKGKRVMMMMIFH